MTDKELLQEIINEHRRELLKADFMADHYEKEIKEMKKMGKQEATETRDLWLKHKETRRQEIKRLEEYGKRKNLI